MSDTKIFYISDLHLRDQAIFNKCKRPFANLEEMEKTIITNWNSKVNDNDVVYVLGDIGDDNPNTINVYKGLKGHKHLIVGNHDHVILDAIKESGIFETINFIELIEDSGHKVCLCHYPVMDWMEFNRQGYFVFGHIHNKSGDINGNAYKQIKDYFLDKPAFNCGVDVTGFTPVTLQEMIEMKEEGKDDPYIH